MTKNNFPEFTYGQKVSYYNGETFFKATVYGMYIHPVSESIKYQLQYRLSSSKKGLLKIEADPEEIRESKYFRR